MQSIKLTVITAHDCELAKTFRRETDGTLISTAIAHMTTGQAQVIEINDPSELGLVLDNLDIHQAITCGIPVIGDTPLTTREGLEFNPHAIARTNEAFRYPDGAALYPVDVDVEGDTYRTVDEVLDALEAASPWLKDCLRVARPSSSSYVGGRGLRGVHVYLAVTRGSDIPSLGKRMQAEQWAAGRGFVKISKSGALLVRQLSDALVYQPSRLMFEAAPLLHEVSREVPHDQTFLVRGPDIRAGRQARYRSEDGFLDVQALPALREIEWRRFEIAKKQAKDAKRADAKRTALTWHAQRAAEAGLTVAEGDLLGVQALRIFDTRVLPPDWPLAVWTPEGRVDVTVTQILEIGEDAFGYSCADPFDSHITNLTRAQMGKAEIVCMNGKPGVWSHKLQEFFEFGDSRMTFIDSPLEVAAERLCGTIEHWPDRKDSKRNSALNVAFALDLIAKESGLHPRFNVCLHRIEADDVPPIGDFLRAVSRLGCSSVPLSTLERAFEALAMRHPCDPWRDQMLQLPQWDGTARLDTVFTDVFDTDDGIALRHVSQAFFAGLVMRQLQPGAPAPIIPVLIGRQGVGKSLFVLQLAQAAGFPAPTQLFLTDDRRMSMAASRAPVAELCEMAGLARKEAEDIKRWISDDRDVYRAPYEREEIEHPRRFVLCGTANKNEVNRDETGNRRLFPIEVRGMHAHNWSVEVPQILAEAKQRHCQSFDAYTAMLRVASDAVRTYNELAMLRGEGTPISDLDDLMPGILENALTNGDAERVPYTFIRAALEHGVTGRKANAREVARWLAARGWLAKQDSSGRRVYQAPQHFIDKLQSKAVGLPDNPFIAHTAITYGEQSNVTH